MNKKAILMIAIVLAATIFISGCSAQTSIKSVDEASEAVTNVSTDIDDVSSTLKDIDSDLGG